MNGNSIAECRWVEGNLINQSAILIPPYLLLVKVLNLKLSRDKQGSWSSYIYSELKSAIGHIEKLQDKEHRLYVLDGNGDHSRLHLIHSILRVRKENGEEYLMLKDVNHDEVLACPVSDELLGGERNGEPIYLKAYHWTMSSLAKKMLNRKKL
jgi:hypothetical protein